MSDDVIPSLFYYSTACLLVSQSGRGVKSDYIR